MTQKLQMQTQSYPVEAAKIIEIPRSTKEISCGKCGRTMTVSERTVLAYCPACSQGMGVKR
jgi:Zn finger protein HypA/HybF involved in hydrogenase expression